MEPGKPQLADLCRRVGRIVSRQHGERPGVARGCDSGAWAPEGNHLPVTLVKPRDLDFLVRAASRDATRGECPRGCRGSNVRYPASSARRQMSTSPKPFGKNTSSSPPSLSNVSRRVMAQAKVTHRLTRSASTNSVADFACVKQVIARPVDVLDKPDAAMLDLIASRVIQLDPDEADPPVREELHRHHLQRLRR